MSKANLKTLSIAQSEAEKNSALYLLNTSNPKGVLNFDTRDGAFVQTVSVPVTWIPFDATTASTKAAILSSPNFRKLVNMGFVKIVDTAEAEAFLQNPDAQKEMQRVFNMLQAGDATVQADAEFKSKVDAESGNVSSATQNIAHADFDEESAMVQIRNNEDEFTQHDWQYLSLHSKHPTVKEYAAAKLNGN